MKAAARTALSVTRAEASRRAEVVAILAGALVSLLLMRPGSGASQPPARRTPATGANDAPTC